MTKKSKKQKSLQKKNPIINKKEKFFMIDNKKIHTVLLSNRIRQSIMELYNANILQGQLKCDNNSKIINV